MLICNKFLVCWFLKRVVAGRKYEQIFGPLCVTGGSFVKIYEKWMHAVCVPSAIVVCDWCAMTSESTHAFCDSATNRAFSGTPTTAPTVSSLLSLVVNARVAHSYKTALNTPRSARTALSKKCGIIQRVPKKRNNSNFQCLSALHKSVQYTTSIRYSTCPQK